MTVLVPLADGFEEIEAMTVVDVLRRASLHVVTAGIPSSIVTGARGMRIIADKKISDIGSDFEAIVLVGGDPGYRNLAKNRKVLNLVKELHDKGKLVAAICASPSILTGLGLLDKKKATIYPGMEHLLPKPRSEDVVIDENVITSKGPGTSMKFALKIVEKLKGTEKVLDLKRDLVC